MQKTLHFYTTLGCHLCELAEDITEPVATKLGVRVEKVEIADSDALIERYGVRIPVIRAHGTTLELGWPFDASGVEALLKQAFGDD